MATVTKGRTFVSGETVTPAKLNELVDNATVTAIQTADIDDAQITTAKINDAAVTTAKINDAAVTPAKLSQPYTLETYQAAATKSFVDFTSIPSWAKRLTIMMSSVSFSGSAHMLIQVGSGSFSTSGYASWSNFLLGGTNSGIISSSAGFVILMGAATNTMTATVNINLLAGNTWLSQGVGVYDNGAQMFTAGRIALSGSLDRVRITRSNATDTFDAGTINISYEG